MTAGLWKVGTTNAYNSSLNGSITSLDSTITLTTTSGLQAPGILVIDRVNSSNVSTPTIREYISFTGIDGQNITGVTRGLAQSTAQSHNSGAVIEECLSVTHWGDLYDFLMVSHDANGKLITSTATIANLRVTDLFSTSGASLVGFYPSSASGGVLTSIGNGLRPVFSTPTSSSSSTDGWTADTNTWTYGSADAPTFTITVAGVDLTSSIGVGDKIKLTQTTAKYFIVTAIAFSTNTTITVYGGTDYTLANATITSPNYSHSKTPFGFPTDPTKWTVLVTNGNNNSQSTPSANTWYNPGSVSITIPVGAWNVSWHAIVAVEKTSATVVDLFTTLSTANNTETDTNFTSFIYQAGASGNMGLFAQQAKQKFLVLASKTTYYLNVATSQSSVTTIYTRGDKGSIYIRAVCAYL